MSGRDPSPIPKHIVLAIHEDQLKRNGGMPGVRDEGLLDSALAQPFASFGGQDLYPSVHEKRLDTATGSSRTTPSTTETSERERLSSSPSYTVTE